MRMENSSNRQKDLETVDRKCSEGRKDKEKDDDKNGQPHS